LRNDSPRRNASDECLVAIGIVVLWLVWRFVTKKFSRPEPSESLDDPLVEDPFSGVPSPKRRGPQNRSGAIALAEPNDDEEDENRIFPPRTL
jgi:hypothetical protein